MESGSVQVGSDWVTVATDLTFEDPVVFATVHYPTPVGGVHKGSSRTVDDEEPVDEEPVEEEHTGAPSFEDNKDSIVHNVEDCEDDVADPDFVGTPHTHVVVPLVVRVRSVSAQSFQLRVQNPGDRVPVHATVKVSWVVLESGDHYLPNRQYVRVGKTAIADVVSATANRAMDSQSGAAPTELAVKVGVVPNRIAADVPFELPAMLHQVQTNNDDRWSESYGWYNREQIFRNVDDVDSKRFNPTSHRFNVYLGRHAGAEMDRDATTNAAQATVERAEETVGWAIVQSNGASEDESGAVFRAGVISGRREGTTVTNMPYVQGYDNTKPMSPPFDYRMVEVQEVEFGEGTNNYDVRTVSAWPQGAGAPLCGVASSMLNADELISQRFVNILSMCEEGERRRTSDPAPAPTDCIELDEVPDVEDPIDLEFGPGAWAQWYGEDAGSLDDDSGVATLHTVLDTDQIRTHKRKVHSSLLVSFLVFDEDVHVNCPVEEEPEEPVVPEPVRPECFARFTGECDSFVEVDDVEWPAGDWSSSMWVRTGSTDFQGAMLAWLHPSGGSASDDSDDGNENDFAVRIHNVRELKVKIDHQSTDSQIALNNRDDWRLVALTWTAADENLLVYIDGVLCFESHLPVSGDHGGVGQLLLGAYGQWDDASDSCDVQCSKQYKFFQGDMDDVRLWSVVLTDEEILALWEDETVPRSGSNGDLVLHVDFSELCMDGNVFPEMFIGVEAIGVSDVAGSKASGGD